MGIDGRAQAYRSLGTQHIFRAHTERGIKHIPRRLRIKRQLDNARAVSQIDKNQLPQVTLTLTPAHQAYLCTHICFGQLGTIVCSVVIFSKQFCHCCSLLVFSIPSRRSYI